MTFWWRTILLVIWSPIKPTFFFTDNQSSGTWMLCPLANTKRLWDTVSLWTGPCFGSMPLAWGRMPTPKSATLASFLTTPAMNASTLKGASLTEDLVQICHQSLVPSHSRPLSRSFTSWLSLMALPWWSFGQNSVSVASRDDFKHNKKGRKATLGRPRPIRELSRDLTHFALTFTVMTSCLAFWFAFEALTRMTSSFLRERSKAGTHYACTTHNMS